MGHIVAPDRVLPHNLEAEKCILGAILGNGEAAFRRVAGIVGPEDFFRDAHRRLFQSTARLTERECPIDLVTIKNDLAAAGDLEHVGGPAYVSALTDGVPRSANVEHYARIVKEKAEVRRLVQAASDAMAQAMDGADVEQVAQTLSAGVAAVQGNGSKSSPTTVDDVAILAQPDLIWAIDKLIHCGTAGMVVGPSGACKTGLVMLVAFCLALKRRFLGAAVSDEAHGPVLWIPTEGPSSGLRNRVAAMKIEIGIPLDAHVGIHFYDGGIDLNSKLSMARIEDQVGRLAARAVVIDTITGALPGQDQNLERVMGGAATALCRLAYRRQCVVTAIHHTRQDEQKERGSTAFRAGLDWAWNVSRSCELLTVSCLKMRDGAEFPAFDVEFVEPPGLPSYVLRAPGTLREVPLNDTPLSPKAEQVLKTLRTMFGRDGATVTEIVSASAISERQVFNVLPRLQERGLVRKESKRWIASESGK